jgi:hypothetical protein
MRRLLSLAAVALAAVAVSAPAQAQTRDWLNNGSAYSAPDRQSYYDSRRVAYDNGFREGAKQGEKDGRSNRAFAYQDDKTYQRGDKGYHREYGTIDRYRQTFRTGYAAGYSDGYQRYAPAYSSGGYGNGRYGQGRAVPRNGGVWGGTAGPYPQQYPQQYPQYPQYPTYPQYPATYGGYGSVRDIAAQNGFNDGVEKGAEDARKNRSYDPLRHDWYRSADRHYESQYGSREDYKNFYRDGFKSGYDRGYRQGLYR